MRWRQSRNKQGVFYDPCSRLQNVDLRDDLQYHTAPEPTIMTTFNTILIPESTAESDSESITQLPSPLIALLLLQLIFLLTILAEIHLRLDHRINLFTQELMISMNMPAKAFGKKIG